MRLPNGAKVIEFGFEIHTVLITKPFTIFDKKYNSWAGFYTLFTLFCFC